MRHILLTPILFFGLLLISCNPNDFDDCRNIHNLPKADTYVSTRMAIALGDDTETLRVNSMRVIIFRACAEYYGEFVTHRLYRPQNHNIRRNAEADSLIIYTGSFSDYAVVPTVSGLSYVFVILNENVGGLDLTGVHTVEDLQLQLRQPIPFTAPIASYGEEPPFEEPAFIMYASAIFEVPYGRCVTDPYLLDFTDLDPSLNDDKEYVQLIRPLIRVTITDITNAWTGGATPPDPILEQTSLIYILEIGFNNVPTTYFLNSELNPSGATPWAFHPNPLQIDRRTIQPDRDEVFFVRSEPTSLTLHLDGRIREIARAGTGGQVFLDGCHSTEIISLNRNDIIRSAGFSNIGRYSRLTTGGTATQSGTGFAGTSSFNLFFTPNTTTRLPSNQTGLDILVNAQRQANNGNRTALDRLIVDARQRTDNASVHDYIGRINTGVQTQLSNLLGGAVLNPGGEFVHASWGEFEEGGRADLEFKPGIWSLRYKPSFYLPENRSSYATELHLKAAQLTGEAIAIGGFERPSDEVVARDWTFSSVEDSEYRDNPDGTRPVFVNVPSSLSTAAALALGSAQIREGQGRWVFHNPLGGAGATNWTIAQMVAHWRFEVIRVVDAGTANARIISLDEPGGDLYLLHYIETGIYQWRFLNAEGSTTLTCEQIDPSSFTDFSPTATFAIPISSGTPAHTFRNHEYRFSVHATHPWVVPPPAGGGDSEAAGGAVRSAGGQSPFVLQQVE